MLFRSFEYGAKGTNIRFFVTSLPANKVPPGQLYTQKYSLAWRDGKSLQGTTIGTF